MKNSDLKKLNRVTEFEEAQLRTAAVIYALKKINGMTAPYRKLQEDSAPLHNDGWLGMWRHPYY
jgi:hypothetical protein